MLGHMVRLRPDGSKLTWRVATMSRFDEEGRAPKPFFITWDDPSLRPDKVQDTAILHELRETSLTWRAAKPLIFHIFPTRCLAQQGETSVGGRFFAYASCQHSW